MENDLTEKPIMIRYNFECKINKQKLLLDALLRYGHLDLMGLSAVLHVLVDELREVHKGREFLRGSSAKKLALLFLICFSD